MARSIPNEIKEQVRSVAKNDYLNHSEIAKMFGISRPSVSRILSKKPKVRRETRKDAGLVCPITGFKFF